MAPIKIIGIPLSQNVRKPLALAYQLGLDVESVPVMPGDDSVKALNPSGRIPVMDDNGCVIAESDAIMIYLANKKPCSFYPDDPAERAKVHQWLFWDMAHWTPSYQPIQFQRLVKQLLGMGPSDEAGVEKTLELFYREATILNDALDGRDWLVGDSPTLADFAVGAGLTYAEPIRLPLEDYPNIRAWNERLNELEGWKKTVPQQ